MKTLLIFRHAKSSWKHPELADHDRSLNKRGKLDAPMMGELLRNEDALPELILSSSANRARTTAELFIEGSGFDGDSFWFDQRLRIALRYSKFISSQYHLRGRYISWDY